MQAQEKHGHTKNNGTPEYNAWRSMIQRCHNPKNPAYRHYGGRGIRVCRRWRRDFRVFLADMKLKPTDQHSIDRINNEGNYEPENCRWATWSEQRRNTRNSRRLTYRDETLSLSDWADRLGTTSALLASRLNRGWTVVEAFETPFGASQVARSRAAIVMLDATFGELTVVKRLSGSDQWHARCSCGKWWSGRGASLREGNTRSCGCLRRRRIVPSSSVIRRLGKSTDAALAKVAGVSHETVRRWRKARGIPAASCTGSPK